MGELTAALERVRQQTLALHRRAFETWTNQTVASAMRHVREGGSHSYGTKTPATKGRGPAVVFGDLARSVGSTPIIEVNGALTVRIGPRDEPHPVPPRKSTRRTHGRRGKALSSGEIGEILETKTGYPFLKPASDEAQAAAEGIWLATFKEF